MNKRRQTDRRFQERRSRKVSIEFADRRTRCERRAFDRRTPLGVKIFYRLTKPIVRAVLYLLWIKRADNIDNVPKVDSAIIAANHCSYLDFFIISAVIRRRLYFLAAQELHRVAFLKWFMRYNERIYLDRERPGVKYFREVVRILRHRRLVVLFPEGTRSEDGKIHRARLGFVKLAVVARVPIIPMGISGTFEVFPKGAGFPRLSRKCEIRIGEPIFLDGYYEGRISKKTLQDVADGIMDGISKLSKLPKAYHT